ncbi:unnamed protein product [Rotaria sp. Silwood2]|nr:unnamed protein product [Rotaria sp. Silwood2]CAF2989193.1 unnamed protein product [Rotaria sp. Silwood2]CAF3998476.1 unnamed protein product [Rotaria sp. Silwood2]CAF4024238.1 unnamed protein product [Rotaria sp. Silwood2]
MLNAIARSIYYMRLYQKDEQYVKSYVIKTIVLWMCEEIDFDEMFKTEMNEEIIVNKLGQMFVSYLRKKLCSGICEHYFIENINLFEQCNQTYLDMMCNRLENPINNRNESLTKEFYYHFSQFTPDDTLYRLIQATNEMINEFHQIQLTHFDRMTSVYIPSKFDPLLNQLFYQLYRVETDDQWWTKWKNYFLDLQMTTNDRNYENEFDLCGISINDIYFVLQDFAYDIQQEWNNIDYLLMNNTLTRFIYYNQSSTVNYAIQLCSKMLYDRNIYFLRGYSLTQILFNGSFATNIDDQKKIIQTMIKACFLKESRQIQEHSLIHINETEQASFSKEQLIEEYWLQVLPHIIMDLHELADMGFSNSGSLFSPSVEETKGCNCGGFLRTFYLLWNK